MPATSDSSSPPRRRRRRGRRRGRSSSSPSAPARSRPGWLDLLAIGFATLTGDAAALLIVRRDPAALPFEGLPTSCLFVSDLPPPGQVLCGSPPPSAGGSGFSLSCFGGFSGPGPTLRLCLRSWSRRPACYFVRLLRSCRLIACHGPHLALFRSRFLPSSFAISLSPVTFVVIMVRTGGDHPLRALAGRIVGTLAGPDSFGPPAATPARAGSAAGASVPAAGATQAAPAQPAPLMVTVLPKTLVMARLPPSRWIPLPLPRSARLRLRHLTRRLLRLLARSSWVLPCRSRARRPTLQHLVVSAALRPASRPPDRQRRSPASRLPGPDNPGSCLL